MARSRLAPLAVTMGLLLTLGTGLDVDAASAPDLAIKTLQAPATIKEGQKATIKILVHNPAAQKVTGITATLEVKRTIDAGFGVPFLASNPAGVFDLPPRGSRWVFFAWTPDATHPHDLRASVSRDGVLVASRLHAVSAPGMVTSTGIDPGTVQARITGVCEAGSSIRAIARDGSVACHGDVVGEGTVTSVGAGQGLLGGPITSAGSLAIDSAYVQRRVSTACTPGSAITSIAEDGSVACSALNLRPGFTRTAVDTTGDAGHHTSIAIGTDGLPIISYQDATNRDLKVAHCSDIACATATVSTIDAAGDMGWFTSIAIGADGLPIVSYYDNGNGDLKVAHCRDIACAAATVSAIDAEGDVGLFTSIAIGTDGVAIISYYDPVNKDLKVAHCNDTACASATTTAIDTVGDVGRHTSIVIGADGLPVISYHDRDNEDLKVARCSNVACTAATTAAIDEADLVGLYTSITIGTDGSPIISYQGGPVTNMNLKVARCSDITCNTASSSVLDAGHAVGLHTSIVIGADGLPVVSYWYLTDDQKVARDDLRIARCNDPGCATATISAIDTVGDVGRHTSIAIGADGLPLISYHDETNGDLKVAHLGNRFGLPHVRHR